MKREVVVCTPSDAARLVLHYGRMKQEHFGVILLDSAKRVLKKKSCLSEVLANAWLIERLFSGRPASIRLLHWWSFITTPQGTRILASLILRQLKAYGKGARFLACNYLTISSLENGIISRSLSME